MLEFELSHEAWPSCAVVGCGEKGSEWEGYQAQFMKETFCDLNGYGWPG